MGALLIFLIFITLSALIITQPSLDMVLEVRCTALHKLYKAKRCNGCSGSDLTHWDFYDPDDVQVIDNDLKERLFESIKGEDWYGDYEYYID